MLVPTTSDGNETCRLGFAYSVEQGAGRLKLAEQTIFGWLHLEQLELEVPGKPAEVDEQNPAEAFQRLRTLARSASLRVNQRDLDRLLPQLGDAIAEVGFEELSIGCRDGYLSLIARVRDQSHVADLSARIYLGARKGNIFLCADQIRVYGFLPSPAILLIHRLFERLSEHPLLVPLAPEVTGLATLSLDPLGALFWHTLPRAGWRLPDTNAIAVSAIQIDRSSVQLTFGEPRTEPGAVLEGPATDIAGAAEALRGADLAMRDGEIEIAIDRYRKSIAAAFEGKPTMLERILGMFSARRSLFADAFDLARQAFDRWPNLPAAHAATGSMAVAQGDTRLAAQSYRQLAETGAANGDDELAITRAALMAARLLRSHSPEESTALYELVLEHRPADPEAMEGLASRYEEEGRWEDLAGTLRSRIAAMNDPVLESRQHLRLARVLADKLEDVTGAREELDTACKLDPDNPEAFEALGDLQAELSDAALAIGALDHAAGLHSARGDSRGESRAYIRTAEIWEQLGDNDAAWGRYQRALELAPSDVEILRGAARAASRIGREEKATELWRRVCESTTLGPAERATDNLEYGRILLRRGDSAEARPYLEHAAGAPTLMTAAEASVELAEIELAADNPEAAADHLERAVETLLASAEEAPDDADSARARAAALLVRRAEALLTAEQEEASAREYARVFELAAPQTEPRRQAAAALLDEAKRRNDPESQRMWLRALLNELTEDAEKAPLWVERARLVAESAATASPEQLSGAAEELAAALPRLDDATHAMALEVMASLQSHLGDPEARARALAERAGMAATPEARIMTAVESAEAWLAADERDLALAAAQRAIVFLQEVGGNDRTNFDDLARWRDRALVALGEAAWRSRDWDDVVRAYTPLIEESDDERPPEVLGMFRQRLGLAHDHGARLDEAARCFESIVNDERVVGELRASTWRLIAGVHERLGHSTAAAEAFEAFARDELAGANVTAKADAWYRAGDLYRKSPEHQESSERCLEQALALVSDHLPALDTLERLKRDQEDFERVAVILGRKIAATTRQPARQKSLLVRLAVLQEELDRSDVARQSYERALEIDPDYRPALRLAARDARHAGDYPRAADALSRLAHQLPEDDDHHTEEVGGVWDERVRAATALAELRRLAPPGVIGEPVVIAALEAVRNDDPSCAPVLEELGRIHRERDHWTELADVLSRRAAAAQTATAALPYVIEHIEILWHKLDDVDGARDAAMSASARFGPTPELSAYLEAVERERRTRDPQASVGNAEVDELLAQARELLSVDDPDGALALLEPVAVSTASSELLLLRAEICELVERWQEAARDLSTLRVRAVAARNTDTERKLTRRLAAITRDHLRDDAAALELYTRALQLDSEDLAAAEACAGIHGRRGAKQEQREALEQVVQISRRTGAGPTVEAAALRELATLERSRGELATASEHLEAAIAIAPDDTVLLRELANLATAQGKHEQATSWLERLAEFADDVGEGHDSGSFGNHQSQGELLLELADIYYDHIEDVNRARDAIRRAARAFGEGPRRDATMRLLASEASASRDYDEAAEAYEAIGTNMGAADRMALARCYQRAGRDQLAIDTLSEARDLGQLSEDGGVLLVSLHHSRQRKATLAASLERGANHAPPGIASTRLREALRLYQRALNSQEDADRLSRHLERLAELHPAGPDSEGLSLTPTAEELERAAEAASAGEDSGVAADLLARALVERARELGRGTGGELDERALQTLDSLRDVAQREHHFEALARGLTSAASVEKDTERACGYLREAAEVRRTKLRDVRGAADVLARALALRPHDRDVVADLDRTLREAGDFSQLVCVYELHAGAGGDTDQANAFVALARIHRDVFEDHEQASHYASRARLVAPAFADEILEEFGDLPVRTEKEPEPLAGPILELEEYMSEAIERERVGDIEGAIARCRTAWKAYPESQIPLDALVRHYEQLGDDEALVEVLTPLAELTTEPKDRAEILLRRATVLIQSLGREPEAYSCLKEAFANDPTCSAVVGGLRRAAMARSEWALVAELIYREIASLPDGEESDRDRAALYFELGLVYDERIHDREQAVINYDQALKLDDTIPAVPRLLARLYELGNRYNEAADMYERAADGSASSRERARLLRLAAMNAEKTKDTDEADRLYRKAAENSGETESGDQPRDSNDARAQLAELESIIVGVQDRDEEIRMRRRLLEVATSLGDTEAIQRHAKALLQVSGDGVDDYLAVKSRAAAERNWDALVTLLATRAELEEAPHNKASLFYELGRIYQEELDDFHAAVSAYENALAVESDHGEALAALAECAYQSSDWERAHDLYQRVDPTRTPLEDHGLAYRRGEIAELLGREREALEQFSRAVELRDDDADALQAVARCALRCSELARARTALEQLLGALPPDDAGALTAARLQLAECAELSGDKPAAIELYERVLEDEPKGHLAIHRLVELYTDLKDGAGAARSLRALISVTTEPEQRAELFYQLGEAYRELLGDEDLAADAYLKGIDLDPDHVPTLYQLLDYYWRVGDMPALAEVAADLNGRGALKAGAIPNLTLARTALGCAASGAAELATESILACKEEAPGLIADALVEIADRGDLSGAHARASETRALCAACGIDTDNVIDALATRGSRHSATLADGLRP